MDLAVWTYPWDVAEEGIDTVLRNIRDVAQCNGISLASAYHNFKQLRPHSSPGRKIYVGEGGVVYFNTDESRYGRIKPVTSNVLKEIDAFQEACDRRQEYGIDVSAWTVIMHNTRQATANPDAAMHTAHGDPSPHVLCPSNSDSREFAVALCSDLAHNYDLRAVELEAVGFLGFNHGYHHDKIGAPLGEWGAYLLGICFCDSCLNRANDAGVDGRGVMALVRSELDGIYDGSDVPPDLTKDQGVERWLRDEPEFSRYQEVAVDSVASLIDEIRAACSGSGTKVILQGEPFEETLDANRMREVVAKIDGVLVSAYNITTAEAGELMERSRKIAGEKELIVAIQAHYPEIPSSDEWRSKVRLCMDQGATGLNFYNYGISTMSQLRGVGAVLAG